MRYIFWILIFMVATLEAQNVDYSLKAEYREELISITKRPEVKAALDQIVALEPFTLRNHIDLNEIEAPPFGEEVRAQAMMKLMTLIGIDSLWIDKVGNVIGLRKGKGGKRTVALDAHLDTVFPKGTDVKVSIKNDTLIAPGIGDDTRGLTMILTVLKSMNDNGIMTDDDVLFVASVGEEGLGDLRGVKYLFGPESKKIDAWISIDGGQIGRISNQGLGSYRYKVTFEGPGGHSWGAFGLTNPHHALGKAIDLFVQLADAFTSYGPKTSYNVGVIGGGTSVNSVPFESYMEIDMRSVSPARLDTMEIFLYDAVNQALKDQNIRKRIGKDMTVTIDKIGDRPSGELSSDLPLVQRSIAATAYFGKRPQLGRGSTNSNIPISLGIPAVTIGRGGTGANAHALDEWWYNEDGHEAIQLALLLLLTEAGTAH